MDVTLTDGTGAHKAGDDETTTDPPGEHGTQPPDGSNTPGRDAAHERLLPSHRAELEASGLTAETVATNGIYSEADAKMVARLLNWGAARARMLGPVLVYPHFDRDGRPLDHATVKPDRPRDRADKPGKVKYENPRQRPNRLYIPAGARAALAGM